MLIEDFSSSSFISNNKVFNLILIKYKYGGSGVMAAYKSVALGARVRFSPSALSQGENNSNFIGGSNDR